MSRSLANSAGRQVHGATSRAEFSLTAAAREGAGAVQGNDGSASSIACFVDQVDVDAVIRDAIDAAAQGRHPTELDAGAMTVLLEPPAVAALLSMAQEVGFGARSFSEGSSFMVGRLGETLFGEELTVADDPYHSSLRSWRFDGEGDVRLRTPLISNGALVAPLTDAYWARQLDLPNTGHGAPKPSTGGPRAEHLVMDPGTRDRSELLDIVGDGLLVRDLQHVNIVEPRDLTLTGMTRGGVSRVRGGKVAESVYNLGFGQSLVKVLQSIAGVGKTSLRCASPGGLDVVVPSVVIRDFRFHRATGATS